MPAGACDPRPEALRPAPGGYLHLIHYLLLRGWKEALPGHGLATRSIFDEIQELRHNGTEKYSAASLLAEAVRARDRPVRNAHLQSGRRDLERGEHSGLPLAGGLGELYPGMVLRLRQRASWPKPELLGEHLRREGLMLRRIKQEVLKRTAAQAPSGAGASTGTTGFTAS